MGSNPTCSIIRDCVEADAPRPMSQPQAIQINESECKNFPR